MLGSGRGGGKGGSSTAKFTILWSAYWPNGVPVLVEIVLCDLAVELL